MLSLFDGWPSVRRRLSGRANRRSAVKPLKVRRSVILVSEVVSRGQRQLADAHVGQAVAGDDVEPLGAGIDAVDEEAGRRACQTGLGERVANILPLQIFGQGAAVLDLEIIIIDRDVRSEEHTSELQSLMRISYAVFCLKKKK